MNVYSVGLYVLPGSFQKAMKGFKGETRLETNAEFFDALLNASNPKHLHLLFARGVGSEKIIDALTSSLRGIKKPVLDQFREELMGALGGQINKGDSLTLGWVGAKDLSVEVRGNHAFSITDASLVKSIFELYIGNGSVVSPAAKTAFARGAATLL